MRGGRAEAKVAARDTAHAMGNDGVHVAASPFLVGLCARAAADALADRPAAGETALIRRLALEHRAAAPEGATVDAEARPVGAGRGGAVFEVAARWGGEVLMSGTVALVRAAGAGRAVRGRRGRARPAPRPDGRFAALVHAGLLGTAGGFPDAPVLGEPWLSLFCETAADAALRPRCSDGEATVGVALDLEYPAAAPPGRVAAFSATIESFDGRRARLAVRGVAGGHLLARGTHDRVVVALDRFLARLPKPPAG